MVQRRSGAVSVAIDPLNNPYTKKNDLPVVEVVQEDPRESSSSLTKKSSMSKSALDSIDQQIVDSHEKCKFCIQTFEGNTEKDRLPMKRQLIKKMRQGDMDIQFEFFSLCLVSYQLNFTKNVKIMKLDRKELYKQVNEIEKLPFNKWYKWLGDYIEKLTLESMYGVR